MPVQGAPGMIPVIGDAAADLRHPDLQPPPMPWWLGRGTDAERALQSRIAPTLVVFLAYAKGQPEKAPDLRLRADATPEERAAAWFARSWLYELDDAQIQLLYPLVARQTLAQLRKVLWIEGVDPAAVRQQTSARFQADIPALEQWAEVLNGYVDECDRYLAFTNGVFKQFQTYLAWRAHHERKKEHRVKILSKSLQAVAEIAQYIPYVGWAISTAAIATDFTVQINHLKEVVKSLETMGERVVALQHAANAMEATMATAPIARNLLAEVLVAIAIREEYLKTGGATVPGARAGGVRARSRRGRAGTALAVGGGLAAAAALLLAVR